MRKLLIALLIVIVTMSIVWIFAGRQISELVDQFGTVEVQSTPIESIAYGNVGKAGMLDYSIVVNGQTLSLSTPGSKDYASFGITKQNEFAVSWNNKIFPLGPTQTVDDESKASDFSSGGR